MENQPIKLNELLLTNNETAFTGVSEFTGYIVTGARLTLTLKVFSIDVGASISVVLADTIDEETGYDDVGVPLNSSVVGSFKSSYVDFNRQIRIRATVTGGNATFKIGVILRDNAIGSEEQLNTLPPGMLTGVYDSFQADYDNKDNMLEFRTYVAGNLKDRITLVYDNRDNVVSGTRSGI